MSQGYLIHLFGKDDTADPVADVTLRLSSMPYHKADYVYRNRIVRLDLLYDMEANLGGINTSTASLEVRNEDRALDDWYAYRITSAEIRKGDLAATYQDSRFPVIWQGPVQNIQRRTDSMAIIIGDQLSQLNHLVTRSDITTDIFGGEAAAGTMLRSYLTYSKAGAFETELEASDLVTSTFNALDTDLPLELKVVVENEINFLTLLDRTLAGTLYALAQHRNGQLAVSKFEVKTSGTFDVFEPIGALNYETIHPAAEITPSFLSGDEDGGTQPYRKIVSNEVKERWVGIWRALRSFTLYSNEGNNGTRRGKMIEYATRMLKFFGRRFDRVHFDTWQPLDNLDVGDTILVKDGDSNVQCQVTRIRERLSGVSEITGWVLNDNHDPAIILPPTGQTITLNGSDTTVYLVLSGTANRATWSDINIPLTPVLMADADSPNLDTVYLQSDNDVNGDDNHRIYIAIGDPSVDNFTQEIFDSGSFRLEMDNLNPNELGHVQPSNRILRNSGLFTVTPVGKCVVAFNFADQTDITSDRTEPYTWDFPSTGNADLRRALNNLVNMLNKSFSVSGNTVRAISTVKMTVSLEETDVDYTTPGTPTLNSISANAATDRIVVDFTPSTSGGEVSCYIIRISHGSPGGVNGYYYIHADEPLPAQLTFTGLLSGWRFRVRLYAQGYGGNQYRSAASPISDPYTVP